MADHSITLLLGGARSGKSSYAEKLAEKTDKELYYIATAEAHDQEMIERIKKHQARRVNGWRVFEEPLKISETITEYATRERVILVDCLTLWLSNIMCKGHDVMPHLVGLISSLENVKGSVIFVANEVGLGIVPENKLARSFRDEAGRMNKAVASVASDVYFMAAGLPLCMKKNGQSQL